MIAAVHNSTNGQYGKAYRKLKHTLDLGRRYQEDYVNRGASSSRGPVKSRLGTRPYEYGNHGRVQRPFGSNTGNFKQESGGMTRPKPDYSQMVCNFCGKKGHIKNKCFKLKNLHRDAVNLVDSYKPGPSADRHIVELLDRMKTSDSDGEESDSDTYWKRRNHGAPESNQDA
nr:uncharacterized protein LOC115259757 [Aedes albopictus]XP_029716408.1 uncharacterized protein LOC115259758 [Aedes albopictus]